MRRKALGAYLYTPFPRAWMAHAALETSRMRNLPPSQVCSAHLRGAATAMSEKTREEPTTKALLEVRGIEA